jgi:hypothetical protein
MDKLNRLGWAAGLSFVSHGVRVGVRVNDPATLQRVTAHLPPGWKPVVSPVVDDLCSLVVGGNARPGVRRYNLLYWGAGRVARTLDSEEVFQALEALLHLVVSVRARRKLFVRAAVVGWRGRAVVICGPPSSGKTMLLKAMVRAGAEYYSDRYAVLDGRGRVHAYPNRLTLPEGDEEQLLGGRIGTKSLAVGLIMITQYRPGTHWQPRALSKGQAMLALLAETVQVRLQPKIALAICRRAAAGAITLRGKRGEAADVALRLLNRMGSRNHDRHFVNNGT